MSKPTKAPVAAAGRGDATKGARKPIAKRLANALSNAVRLSGNDIGSMSRTAKAPNAIPHTAAITNGGIFAVRFGSKADVLLIEQRDALVVLRRRDRRQIGVYVGEVGVREDLLRIRRHLAVGVAHEDR